MARLLMSSGDHYKNGCTSAVKKQNEPLAFWAGGSFLKGLLFVMPEYQYRIVSVNGIKVEPSSGYAGAFGLLSRTFRGTC